MTPIELVCLHHAGGGSASFHPLRRAFDALDMDVTVRAVNLPGRESRRGEPRHVDARACVRALSEELQDTLERPHVLLGHSMGAFLVHALAQQRISRGDRAPEAVIVAACRAPHERDALANLEFFDDLSLATALVACGGLPPEVLDHPEWLPLLVPTVRDDLRICRSYESASDPPLACPLHVLGGTLDTLAPPDTLDGWSRYSLEPTPVQLFPTGHFLFRTPLPELVESLAGIIAGTRQERSRRQ